MIYKKEFENEADYQSNEKQIAKVYVNYIIAITVPETMTIEGMKDATGTDQRL